MGDLSGTGVGHKLLDEGGVWAGGFIEAGVLEVEVLQDIKEPDYGVDLKKGEVVTLKGNEANSIRVCLLEMVRFVRIAQE